MNFHAVPTVTYLVPFVPEIATPDERERFEHCQERAGKWFADATQAQQAAYNATIAHIQPWRNTPRGERAALRAEAVWRETTADAREVYRMALRDLWLTGEISEATSDAYEDLMVPRSRKQGAPDIMKLHDETVRMLKDWMKP